VRMGRTRRAQLLRERVQEEWADSDGYWIALKSGWHNGADPTCHQIHEDTKQEAWEVFMAFVEPCECRECRQDAAVTQLNVQEKSI